MINKNILITGGLGFIGTNLADALLKQGHLIYLLDDLSTGRYQNLTWLYKNNRDATNLGKVIFIQWDITHSQILKNSYNGGSHEIIKIIIQLEMVAGSQAQICSRKTKKELHNNCAYSRI